MYVIVGILIGILSVSCNNTAENLALKPETCTTRLQNALDDTVLKQGGKVEESCTTSLKENFCQKTGAWIKSCESDGNTIVAGEIEHINCATKVVELYKSQLDQIDNDKSTNQATQDCDTVLGASVCEELEQLFQKCKEGNFEPFWDRNMNWDECQKTCDYLGVHCTDKDISCTDSGTMNVCTWKTGYAFQNTHTRYESLINSTLKCDYAGKNCKEAKCGAEVCNIVRDALRTKTLVNTGTKDGKPIQPVASECVVKHDHANAELF